MQDPSQVLVQAADLHFKGKLDEAERLYLQVLRANPDHLDALHLFGVLRFRQGRSNEAISLLARAIRTNPNFPPALLSYAIALRAGGRPAEALAHFDRALALKPDYAEALYNRGLVLRDLDRTVEALASFEQALAAKPDHVEAMINRAAVLRSLKRSAEALASYDQALAIKPRDVNILISRGNTLIELGHPSEALASYQAALAIDPRHAGAHYNCGNALRDLRRPAEALACFDQALALKPDFVETLNNRAAALRSLRRGAEALASFDRALALRPDDAELHLNRSSARLLAGDLEPGFEEYEWRWRTRWAAPWRRDFPEPLWRGEEALAGRTIMLHAEQGLGDAIQFVRYVPLVAARGASIILEVQPSLTSLFAAIAGVSRVVSRGEHLPNFDWHCPLASLPLAFKTGLDTIPATIPYLSAPQDRLTAWRERLRGPARRVGLAWAGNPGFKGDQTRSIGLARLLPLLSTRGLEFLSLQKDLRESDRDILSGEPRLMHLGDAIRDFSDTAAILASVDLLISSDTAIVHLAGALGVPAWILLQYDADWRWLADRTDSPWYPTARLFRQPRLDDWEGVVKQVQAELARI
jgi:tetratricopeptide (TPR) repeat protein